MNKTTKIIKLILLTLALGLFGWGVTGIAIGNPQGVGFSLVGMLCAGLVGTLSDLNIKF